MNLMKLTVMREKLGSYVCFPSQKENNSALEEELTGASHHLLIEALTKSQQYLTV